MPDLGSFAVDLIGALGGKPTKQSRRLFNSWQRWEGGWSNNDAMYNPLNLTAPGSGLPTINSVGVVSMPSYQEGVRRTADLLKSGYPALAAAFRSGRVDFSNPALQADLNRWLSGQRTPGMTPYVSKIAKSYGANVPMAAVPAGGGAGTPAAATPAAPQTPQWDPMSYASRVMSQFAQGGRADIGSLPGITQTSFKIPPSPPTVPESPQSSGTAPTKGKGIQYRGKEMILPTAWKSTHPTSGLADEGFTHAEDIMGHPGTPVGAPEGGTIVRHGSAQGGQSLWFRADSGRMYWIGHIESNIPVGTRVERGDVIAAISADHPRPHVHLDWSTSYEG